MQGYLSKIFLVFMAFLPFVSHADPKKEYIIFGCREAGMFSVFYDVITLCKYYEDGKYNGIEVNFGKSGLYYWEPLGDNWFNYFCEPIKLGIEENPIYKVGNPPFAPSSYFIQYFSRREAKRIIDKYIHFKPEIIQKVDQFVIDHFDSDFIIGFHYRGTDKYLEAQTVSYNMAYKILETKIKHLNVPNCKIFIATDEQPFIEYMAAIYGDRIMFTDSMRSTDGKPLHKSDRNRYQVGFDAIVDCLLLSKTNYLIKMSSNLSDWATFFNPDIPFIEINNRD